MFVLFLAEPTDARPLVLNLQLENFSSDCSSSFLYVYNGTSVQSPILGIFTGHLNYDHNGHTITSLSGEVRITIKHVAVMQSACRHVLLD